MRDFSRIQTFDAWFLDLPQRTKRIPTLRILMANLQRLCLATAHDNRNRVSKTLRHLLRPEARQETWIEQTALRTLTLYELSLTTLHTLHTPLSRLLCFENLRELTLWNCPGTHVLLADLVLSPYCLQLKLRHLALNIMYDAQPHIDGPLGLVLDLCEELESLYLQWNGAGSYWPCVIESNMKKLGTKLTSLSLDNGMYSKGNEQEPSEDVITKICESCPDLERLEYRMTEEEIHNVIFQFHVEQHHVFVSQSSTVHPNWVQSEHTSSCG
jgi:hypothetical protein